MNKKIFLAITSGLVVALVISTFTTSGAQINFKNDSKSIEQTNLMPSLLGYWNLNEEIGEEVRDFGLGENHGTLIGPTWAEGISGSALFFDGFDYVNCGFDDQSYVNCPRTYAAWVKHTNGGIIVSKLQRIELEIWHGWAIGILPDTNEFFFWSNNVLYTGGEIPLDEWVHVAATWDMETLKIYINGVLDSTFTEIEKPISNDGRVDIGSQYYGIIDEVRLEDNVLDETEIMKLYDNQIPNTPKINGPKTGKAGVEQTYIISATDPDGDSLGFYIDWGDGIIEGTDWYPSNTEVTVKHTYEGSGKFTIKVKAVEDLFVTGFESKWATFKVSMPRTRACYRSLLFHLIQQFPMLERFLNF